MRNFLRMLGFASHAEAHAWSVADPDGFWTAFAEFARVRWLRRKAGAAWDGTMPGRWFEGAAVNYAEQCLAHAPAYLADEVRSVAAGMQACGVGRGDVVAALLPNDRPAVIAALAAAWIGAAWTAVPPEYGPDAVIARLRPVSPSLLLSVDEYAHRDGTVDRREANAVIRAGLPSVEADVMVDTNDWRALRSRRRAPLAVVPFDHPLWITYSSGTTGPPKALVHGHGGVVLDHLKVHGLYTGLRSGDRLCWLTSTGWTMWNHQLSAMLLGALPVPYPADPTWPSCLETWRTVADAGVTVLGVSPAFVARTRAEGVPTVAPVLRRVVSTGAPLTADDAEWLQAVTTVHVSQVSGGTDLAGEVMGECTDLPHRHGWMNCAYLGADVRAVDDDGRDVPDGTEGEMVLAQAMPNMPVALWGDDDGSRYRAAYFERRPGVWHHGDRLVRDGEALRVTGRSDATLNRHGVRLGTAELYAVVDRVPGVTGTLAVHLEPRDRIVLFVSGTATDAALTSAIRDRLSPRFVPDEIRHVDAVPVTASGKKPEVAVKRALLGGPATDEVRTLIEYPR